MNAKEIVKDISFSEHGDYDYIEETISKLLYKWALEESTLRESFIETLDEIFSR